MRVAAGAVLVVVAMSALSARAESAKDGDELINWEGRRDPFSAQLKYEERKIIIVPPQGPVVPIAEVRTQLGLQYAKAERALLEGDSLTAMKECEQGLGLFVSVPDEAIRMLSDERDRLERIHTVADRMLQRQKAEDDFKSLNLTLTGVVQSKQARAILNSQVVSRGEVIAVPNSSQIVVVTDIRDDKVIVRFRGFLMAIDLVDRKG